MGHKDDDDVIEFKEAELNCVKTRILFIPEFKQFEIGISTNRYFPPMGTAGLDLLAVSGCSLEPAPPPNIIETVSFANIGIFKI